MSNIAWDVLHFWCLFHPLKDKTNLYWCTAAIYAVLWRLFYSEYISPARARCFISEESDRNQIPGNQVVPPHPHVLTCTTWVQCMVGIAEINHRSHLCNALGLIIGQLFLLNTGQKRRIWRTKIVKCTLALISYFWSGAQISMRASSNKFQPNLPALHFTANVGFCSKSPINKVRGWPHRQIKIQHSEANSLPTF